MKAIRVISVLLVLLLVCSCSREESTLSDYRSFAKELKVNSSDYTEEDWNNVVAKYNKLEERASNCNFSQKEKKELNKLRGQCTAYMLKTIYKQTKLQMKDAMEQYLDMAEGFNEVLEEDGFESLLNEGDE